jgi:hypothetical protein
MKNKSKIPDFQSQLLASMGRINTNIIVSTIGDNEVYFSQIVDLVLNGKPPLPMRAAWVVTVCLENHPEWLKSHFDKLVKILPHCNHPGTRRSILRSMSEAEIPRKWEGFLISHCFDWLLSPVEPIANKAFSMQILYNLSVKHPEISHELAEVIESQLPTGSPGIRSRGTKIIALLRQPNQ